MSAPFYGPDSPDFPEEVRAALTATFDEMFGTDTRLPPIFIFDNNLDEQSEPRPRIGRGKASHTVALRDVAASVLAASASAMTLRQLFYALVSLGAIPKSEAAYGQLKRVMRDAREDGVVPWSSLVDHTRSVFQPRTWDGVDGLLEDAAKLYRRDLMRSQPVAIQLWAESDSIGSVIAQVADSYTVPTFIGRGYAARGYLWAAAKDALAAHRAGKRVVILHVGDYDPSGEDIFRDVEETLRLYSLTLDWDWRSRALTGCPISVAEVRRSLMGDVRRDARMFGDGGTFADHLRSWTDRWLEFRRLALTPAQIEAHGLPSRPPKPSDVRTAKFAGAGTVEVEALPVGALLAIVEGAILSYIDAEALAAAKVAEMSEREIAKRIAATPVERLLEVSP